MTSTDECRNWLHNAELLYRRENVVDQEVRDSYNKLSSHVALDTFKRDSELDATARKLTEMMSRVRAGKRNSQHAQNEVSASMLTLDAEERHFDTVFNEANALLAAIQDAGIDHNNNSSSKRSSHRALLEAQSLSSDVATRHAEFLMSNGGATLGWHEDDHGVFLRLLLRNAAPLELLEMLHVALPHIPTEELAHHIQLYAQYAQIQQEKKSAIEAFRQQRAADAANELEVNEIRKRLQEVRGQSDAMKNEHRRLKHQEELHKKVAEWKERKEAMLSKSSDEAVKGSSACVQQAARKKPLVVRPTTAPTVKQLTLTSAPTEVIPTPLVLLEKRWEQDMVRVMQRRIRASSTRGPTRQERIAEAAKKVRPEKQQQSNPARLIAPTESSSRRRAASLDVRQGGRDAPIAVTPRTFVGHRASPSWCDKTLLR